MATQRRLVRRRGLVYPDLGRRKRMGHKPRMVCPRRAAVSLAAGIVSSNALQLVDQLRRELPSLRGMPNAEVTARTTPADTGAILGAVRQHLQTGPG
jgi:hypothetical protein